MKHMMTRLVALVLVTLMLLATAVACASDGNTTGEPNSGTTTPGTSDTTPGTSDATPDDQPDTQEPDKELTKDEMAANVLNSFEKRDLSDFEFIAAASSTLENIFITDQFPTEEDLCGNIVQDALFERDKMIEEYYGVLLIWDDTYDSQMYNKIGNSVRSGDDIYSLVLGALHETTLPMFNNQLLYDLNSIENIDLTQPWWNQNSVEAFTLNDKIYMATGAITNRYVRAPYALLFNTRLLENEGLPSPYDLIAEDNWYFDVFQALVVGTSHELDGDDQMTVKDFYGLAPADDSQTAWFFACGGRWVEVRDDELVPVYEEERNYDLLSEVLDFHLTDDIIPYEETYDSVGAFSEGRAIFHPMALIDLDKLADMEDKYGIVPLPKFDEEQENYYSNTNKYINTMALVPTSVVDTDTTGLIIETLAAVSQYTSLDKQYDVILLNRKALDAESKANLQIVVEASCYDWAYVLNPAGISDKIRLTMRGKTEIKEFASYFASVREPVQAALDEVSEMFVD